MTTQERVIAAIARGCYKDPGKINLDSRLDELAVDSLMSLQMLFEVEEEFHISIPDGSGWKSKTVRDVIDKLIGVITTAG